jgi:hypothetical protein
VRYENLPYPDRILEWMFAVMWASWGAWLLIPSWDTFGNPQYAALARLMPEELWGVFSISWAVIRGSALYVNGSHFRTPLIRLVCSALGLVWWMVLIFLFLLAPQSNPAAGFSWYPVFVVFEGINCWRCASDGWHTHAFSRHRSSLECGRTVGHDTH